MRIGEVDAMYISRKFRVLYFFAALAIVLIHSGIMAGMDKQAVWCRTAIDIYTQRLTCWAVPFFFAAAGYWFSQGGYMRGKQSYLIFLKNKIRSLVVPYFLFILIALAVSLPALMAANIIAHRSIWTNTVFSEPSLYEMLNKTFALTIAEPKPLGVMWFIRTLFFIFLFAPLYKVVARYCSVLFLIGVVLFEIFIPGYDFKHFPLWFGAAIWFYLGLWLGVARRGSLVKVKAPIWVPFLFLAIGFLWGVRVADFQGIPHVDMLVKLCFILGIWFLYDHVDRYLPANLPEFIMWSFWLYCTHNMIVLYVIAGGRGLLGRSDAVVCVLPVFVFLISTTLSLTAAWLMDRKFHKAFEVFTGGR